MKTAVIRAGDACSAGTVDGEVIPVDIAAEKAAAMAKRVKECERLSLFDAAGRVLAGGIRSAVDLPQFANSAMDGYAVRLSGFAGNGPWRFVVTGRARAGDPPMAADTRLDGAVRVFTGAAVPQGFDAVIMQEHCERVGEELLIPERPRPGENIRRVGEDVPGGSALVEAGEALTPPRLALLAAAGVVELEVWRKVRVGLLSTGSELRDPGEQLAAGQIYNSNRVLLRSMLAALRWVETIDFGIVPDDREMLSEAIGKASARCDVVLTTGGVSAGEEDHVTAAVLGRGASIEVLKVAMRPGKPLKVGLIGDTLFVGLPGNPNATLVTFRQIALPAIRALAGLNNIHSVWFPAAAGFSYRKKPGRTEFMPVRVEGRDSSGIPVLAMLGRGSSASVRSMAMADGIALLRPEASLIREGELLRFEPLCQGGLV